MPGIIVSSEVNVSSKNFSVISNGKGVDIDGVNGSLSIIPKEGATTRQQVVELAYMLQQYLQLTPKS